MRWQAIPCGEDSLQIGVNGRQGGTIRALVMQYIYSAETREVAVTAIADSGYSGIASGFDSKNQQPVKNGGQPR